MTAVPPARSKPERVWPIAVVILGIIALVCTLPLYLPFASDDAGVVHEFSSNRVDYRIKMIDSDGQVCALLQREIHVKSTTDWVSEEADCAWPAVSGGHGWLAGGQNHLMDASDRLFFGVAPGSAAEVRLTLTTGKTLRIPTRPSGKDQVRFFVRQEPKAGFRTLVTGVELLDAAGGQIRVY